MLTFFITQNDFTALFSYQLLVIVCCIYTSIIIVVCC